MPKYYYDEKMCILDKIFNNCHDELRNFEYGEGDWMEYYKPVPETLITKIFNVENVSFRYIKRSASVLSLNGCVFRDLPISLIQDLNHVQHLTLTKASDELLQSICQYMVG